MKAKFTIFILLALITCTMYLMLINRLSGLNGAVTMLLITLAVFSLLPKINDATVAKNGANGEREKNHKANKMSGVFIIEPVPHESDGSKLEVSFTTKD